MADSAGVTGGELVRAVEDYCPGWVVRAVHLGGVIPAVACRSRHVILMDPALVMAARDRVCALLTSLTR